MAHVLQGDTLSMKAIDYPRNGALAMRTLYEEVID